MYSAYKEICKVLKTDCVLSDFTTIGIGGRANIALFPESVEELVDSLNLAKSRKDSVLVLGGGSNVLVSDRGIDGVVVLTYKLNGAFRDGNTIVAECGARLPALAKIARESSLTGLEFGCGIPGTLGGALRMNAGAYGQTIGESVLSALVWENGETKEVKPSFSYRKSDIGQECVVLSARLALNASSSSEIEARERGMREARASSQPTMKSAGCVFLSDDGVSAGYYIERAGLKGLRVGEAEISEKHAGFIVNRGNATASDVVKLINITKDKVKQRFGKSLTAEIRFIGEFDEAIR